MAYQEEERRVNARVGQRGGEQHDLHRPALQRVELEERLLRDGRSSSLRSRRRRVLVLALHLNKFEQIYI